jgi:hypothetical protein
LTDLVTALTRYEAVLPSAAPQGSRPAAMVAEGTDENTTTTASAPSTKPSAPQLSADVTALLAAQTALVAALAKASAPRPVFQGNCRSCGKWGHMERNCRSRATQTAQPQPQAQAQAKQQQGQEQPLKR